MLSAWMWEDRCYQVWHSAFQYWVCSPVLIRQLDNECQFTTSCAKSPAAEVVAETFRHLFKWQQHCFFCLDEFLQWTFQGYSFYMYLTSPKEVMLNWPSEHLAAGRLSLKPAQVLHHSTSMKSRTRDDTLKRTWQERAHTHSELLLERLFLPHSHLWETENNSCLWGKSK